MKVLEVDLRNSLGSPSATHTYNPPSNESEFGILIFSEIN